ncbi:MAG: hypothetical protein ACAH95_07125 [Fimbriimonas sp.]
MQYIPEVITGVWEDIVAEYGEALHGHWVTVTVLDDGTSEAGVDSSAANSENPC